MSAGVTTGAKTPGTLLGVQVPEGSGVTPREPQAAAETPIPETVIDVSPVEVIKRAARLVEMEVEEKKKKLSRALMTILGTDEYDSFDVNWHTGCVTVCKILEGLERELNLIASYVTGYDSIRGIAKVCVMTEKHWAEEDPRKLEESRHGKIADKIKKIIDLDIVLIDTLSPKTKIWFKLPTLADAHAYLVITFTDP